MTANLQTEQEEIAAVIDSRDRRRSLSTTKFDEFKKALMIDSYIFTKKICGHEQLIPEIHAPISYMATGLTDKLIQTLVNPAFNSYITKYLRTEFTKRGIDWRTIEGRASIDSLLNGDLTETGLPLRPAVINFRMSRRMFKSSVITHGGVTFIATRDPNETIKITHAVDPKAWDFCEQIAKTILSGTYRDYFPERIPQGDLSKLVTMKKITLGERTISHPQKTIEAGGIGTSEESAHYSTFINDDIIADEELSVDEIKKVVKWQKGMTGFYMPTRRIRRLEVGTKHDEDDDDTFLSTGAMAKECLTIRVPIEEHDGEVINILKRGKPTCPKLFPKEKITAEQIHVLSGEEDSDGYRTWWNQYLLSAIGGGLRLFPASLVDNKDHWWLGPFESPKDSDRKQGRFIVARYVRDEEGNPKQDPRKKIALFDNDGILKEDWRENAQIISFDPWRELDRVCTVDPSWSNSGNSDNWGVTAAGCDWEDVKYQLETCSGSNDGTDGWIEAMDYLDRKYHFRVIGFDGAAMQDAMIQNLMKTDRRLRRMASRMIKVSHNNISKTLRMKEGIAEPMKIWRWFLAPPFKEDFFGGNMTRAELKLIKSTPKRTVKDDEDGIADSLSMVPALIKRSRKLEDPASEKVKMYASIAAQKRSINPYLGVENIA